MAHDIEFDWADDSADEKFSKHYLEVHKKGVGKQKNIDEIRELNVCMFGRDQKRTNIHCLNPTMSRLHAAIVHSQGSLYLVDLGFFFFLQASSIVVLLSAIPS